MPLKPTHGHNWQRPIQAAMILETSPSLTRFRPSDNHSSHVDDAVVTACSRCLEALQSAL